MTNDAIPFHLSKSESTISCSTLHRLSRQDLHRASASRMDLVIHHMLETLVIGRIQEDLSFELPSCMPIVHDLQANADSNEVQRT